MDLLHNRCCTKLSPGFSYLIKLINSPNIRIDANYIIVEDLSLDKLSVYEIRYIYSLSSMICQKYIWSTGVDDARYYSNIPLSIGLPLLKSSEYLDIPPVITFSSVCLYNWSLHDETKEISLENLVINHTMTNNISEEWFYKIGIMIEYVGSQAVSDPDRLYEILKECTVLIKRIYEHCDPEFFFSQIRIYLTGSLNDNLPDGIQIGDRILKYKGASGGQSAVVKLFDVMLNVEHNNEFIDEMLEYIPKEQRDYLLNCQIRVEGEYQRECIEQLRKFRMAHLGLINKYIVPYMDNGENNAHSTLGSGLTEPVIFCQNIIDTTKTPNIYRTITMIYSYLLSFI